MEILYILGAFIVLYVTYKVGYGNGQRAQKVICDSLGNKKVPKPPKVIDVKVAKPVKKATATKKATKKPVAKKVAKKKATKGKTK